MEGKYNPIKIIAKQGKYITLQKLENLGYTASDGIYTEYRGYEGELMPVWDDEIDKEAPFCCFYRSDKEQVLIVLQTFEEAAARLDRA